uniref:Uncharacterized protein n=1 Tax=Glossina pallidipes TaxID=7398 RepID=A0A1B0AHA7_GLOPL
MNLLKHPRHSILKEAASTVSNITAGNQAQIQAVIDSGIFVELRNVLEHGDFKSQKEAGYAVTNTTAGGTPEKYQIFKPFSDLLEAEDPCNVVVVLSGLTKFFALASKSGGTENLCLMLEEMGGLDKLENLQQHENEGIYKKSSAIIDTYFSEGDEAEAKLTPQEVNGTFEFKG